MHTLVNVADLADRLAAHVRRQDKQLRRATAKSPYLVIALAAASGALLSRGLVPFITRVVPMASALARSHLGRRALTMFAGAMAAKRLGTDR